MEIGERIRHLRKAMGLTQTVFGKRVMLGQSSLASNERGDSTVDDRTVKLICAEFGVSEVWLRTGEGEMYEKKPDNLIDRLAAEYHMSATAVSFLETYLALSPEMQSALDRLLDEALDRRADRIRAAQLAQFVPEGYSATTDSGASEA